MKAMANAMQRLAVSCVILAILSTLTGCDLYGVNPYAWTSPVYTDTWFPASDLYDPTWEIQSVIDYRQSVMDWSNDAWSDYIRQ
jgi:hypothetical protein